MPTETSAAKKWRWIENQVLGSLSIVLADDEIGDKADRVVKSILEVARKYRRTNCGN